MVVFLSLSPHVTSDEKSTFVRKMEGDKHHAKEKHKLKQPNE